MIFLLNLCSAQNKFGTKAYSRRNSEEAYPSAVPKNIAHLPLEGSTIEVPDPPNKKMPEGEKKTGVVAKWLNHKGTEFCLACYRGHRRSARILFFKNYHLLSREIKLSIGKLCRRNSRIEYLVHDIF